MEKVDISEVIEWAKQFLAQSEKEITNEKRKEQQKYAILVQKPWDNSAIKVTRRIVANTQ